LEYEPPLAPGLLVPVTKGQFQSLRSRGRLRITDRTWVANCPYNEQGVEIYGHPAEDAM
jgi:hypothetical protein